MTKTTEVILTIITCTIISCFLLTGIVYSNDRHERLYKDCLDRQERIVEKAIKENMQLTIVPNYGCKL